MRTKNRTTPLTALFLSIVSAVGCGGSMGSRARTRYVAAHGILPQPSEIRVEDFLADYQESLPDPGPEAVGLTLEGARAQWAAESSEPLYVVQAAVRGRSADIRPPIALMFIVDTSGSMAEADKMTYVREGLHRLVDQLDPRDAVGITAFDDRARLVAHVMPVGERRAELHRAIDTLSPGGSTNLSEGLRVGYAHLQPYAEAGVLRRVVLLTDAIANVGRTDIQSIAWHAGRGDADGIRLSAVGVGLDHEDGVLVQMAREGRGNHYFLDSPARIARVFEEEVNGLLEDVADNVHVTFTPAPGVEVVRVEGAESSQEGPYFRANIGRLGAAQHRIVLFTLRGVRPDESRPRVGTFTMDYINMRTREAQRQANSSPVHTVAHAAEGTVARNSAVAWMARDLQEVSRLAGRGRFVEAEQRLDRVRAVIGAVSAARAGDAELREDLTMVEDFGRALGAHTGRPPRVFRARLTARVEG